MKCWRCNGTGSIAVEFRDVGWVSKVCPICHGKGEESLSNQDILILVDIQNGLCNEFTRPILERLCPFLAEYRFEKVIATKFINTPDSLFQKELEYRGLVTAEDRRLADGILPFVSAVYLKDRYDCIDDVFLQQLRLLNDGVMPEQVLLAGMDTEACILMMAAGLFDRGIRPIVLADFVASSQGEDAHLNGLSVLETLIGKHNLLRLG